MKIILSALFFAFIMVAVGCVDIEGGMQVDVIKTAKGFDSPSKPDDIEILMLRPTKDYVELGAVTVSSCPLGDKARLFNALRAKSAPLGADAVVLQSAVIYNVDVGRVKVPYLWATGAAIKYTKR